MVKQDLPTPPLPTTTCTREGNARAQSALCASSFSARVPVVRRPRSAPSIPRSVLSSYDGDVVGSRWPCGCCLGRHSLVFSERRGSSVGGMREGGRNRTVSSTGHRADAGKRNNAERAQKEVLHALHLPQRYLARPPPLADRRQLTPSSQFNRTCAFPEKYHRSCSARISINAALNCSVQTRSNALFSRRNPGGKKAAKESSLSLSLSF